MTAKPIDKATLDEAIRLTEEKYPNLPKGLLADMAQVESSYGQKLVPINKKGEIISSARGPWQFLRDTGAQYGLNTEEDRMDPFKSADAAARLMLDNKRVLEKKIGRAATNGELYLAHQQGASGAAKLLTNPDAKAVDLLGEDRILKNFGTKDMTASAFAAKFTSKFTGGAGGTAPEVKKPQAAQQSKLGQLPAQPDILSLARTNPHGALPASIAHGRLDPALAHGMLADIAQTAVAPTPAAQPSSIGSLLGRMNAPLPEVVPEGELIDATPSPQLSRSDNAILKGINTYAELAGRTAPALMSAEPTPDLQVAPSGFAGDFMAGFQSGLHQMEADQKYFGAILDTLTGNQQGASDNIVQGRKASENAQKVVENVASIDDLIKNPSFENFLGATMVTTGQITPQLFDTVVNSLMGGAGKVAGNAALNVVGKTLLKDIVGRQARGAAVTAAERNLTDSLYKQFRSGMLEGAAFQEFRSMAGQNFAEVDESGAPMDQAHALGALGVAVPQAAVGVLGETAILKMFGEVALEQSTRKAGDSILKRFAAEVLGTAAKSGATEGVTEGVQESMSVAHRMAIDPTYDGEEAMLRVAEAAIGGFLGGGVLGGAGGIPAVGAATARRVTERGTPPAGGSPAGGSPAAPAAGALPGPGTPPGTPPGAPPATPTVGERVRAAADKARGLLKRVQGARLATDVQTEVVGTTDTVLEGGTTPEPIANLVAQYKELVDPESTRRAMWLTGEDVSKLKLSKPLVPGERRTLKHGNQLIHVAYIAGRGAILSPEEQIVDKVVGASTRNDAEFQAAVAEALNMTSGTKAGDTVVQTVTPTGAVVNEQLVDAEGVQPTVEAQQAAAKPDQSVVVKPVDQALKERKQAVDTEQALASDAEATQSVIDEFIAANEAPAAAPLPVAPEVIPTPKAEAAKPAPAKQAKSYDQYDVKEQDIVDDNSETPVSKMSDEDLATTIKEYRDVIDAEYDGKDVDWETIDSAKDTLHKMVRAQAKRLSLSERETNAEHAQVDFESDVIADVDGLYSLKTPRDVPHTVQMGPYGVKLTVDSGGGDLTVNSVGKGHDYSSEQFNRLLRALSNGVRKGDNGTRLVFPGIVQNVPALRKALLRNGFEPVVDENGQVKEYARNPYAPAYDNSEMDVKPQPAQASGQAEHLKGFKEEADALLAIRKSLEDEAAAPTDGTPDGEQPKVRRMSMDTKEGGQAAITESDESVVKTQDEIEAESDATDAELVKHYAEIDQANGTDVETYRVETKPLSPQARSEFFNILAGLIFDLSQDNPDYDTQELLQKYEQYAGKMPLRMLKSLARLIKTNPDKEYDIRDNGNTLSIVEWERSTDPETLATRSAVRGILRTVNEMTGLNIESGARFLKNGKIVADGGSRFWLVKFPESLDGLPASTAKTVGEMKPGTRVEGKVVEIKEFGAYIDIGVGEVALVMNSELTPGLKVGDKVQARVVAANEATNQVSLSLKPLPERAKRLNGFKGKKGSKVSTPGLGMIARAGVALNARTGRGLQGAEFTEAQKLSAGLKTMLGALADAGYELRVGNSAIDTQPVSAPRMEGLGASARMVNRDAMPTGPAANEVIVFGKDAAKKPIAYTYKDLMTVKPPFDKPGPDFSPNPFKEELSTDTENVTGAASMREVVNESRARAEATHVDVKYNTTPASNASVASMVSGGRVPDANNPMDVNIAPDGSRTVTKVEFGDQKRLEATSRKSTVVDQNEERARAELLKRKQAGFDVEKAEFDSAREQRNYDISEIVNEAERRYMVEILDQLPDPPPEAVITVKKDGDRVYAVVDLPGKHHRLVSRRVGKKGVNAAYDWLLARANAVAHEMYNDGEQTPIRYSRLTLEAGEVATVTGQNKYPELHGVPAPKDQTSVMDQKNPDGAKVLNEKSGQINQVSQHGKFGAHADRILAVALNKFRFAVPMHILSAEHIRQNFDALMEQDWFAANSDTILAEMHALEDPEADNRGTSIQTPNVSIIVTRDEPGSKYDYERDSITSVDSAEIGAVIAHEIGHIVYNQEFIRVVEDAPHSKLWSIYTKAVEVARAKGDRSAIHANTREGFQQWYYGLYNRAADKGAEPLVLTDFDRAVLWKMYTNIASRLVAEGHPNPKYTNDKAGFDAWFAGQVEAASHIQDYEAFLYEGPSERVVTKAERNALWQMYVNTAQRLASEDRAPTDYTNNEAGFEEWYADQVMSYVYEQSHKGRTSGATNLIKQVMQQLFEFFDEVNRILGGRLRRAQPVTVKLQGKAPFEFSFADHMERIIARQRQDLKDGKRLSTLNRLAVKRMATTIATRVPAAAVANLRRSASNLMSSGQMNTIWRRIGSLLQASQDFMRRTEHGPAGAQLAQFFGTYSQSGDNIGWHKSEVFSQNRLNNRLADIFGIDDRTGKKEWDTPRVRSALIEAMNEDIPTANLTSPEAKRVRELYADIVQSYIRNPATNRYWIRGFTPRPNYGGMRMWNVDKIIKHEAAFKAWVAQQPGVVANSANPQAYADRMFEAITQHRQDQTQSVIAQVEADALARGVTLSPEQRAAEQLMQSMNGYPVMEIRNRVLREMRRGVVNPRGVQTALYTANPASPEAIRLMAVNTSDADVIEAIKEYWRKETEVARLTPSMDPALDRTFEEIKTVDAYNADPSDENGWLHPPAFAHSQYMHYVSRRVEYEKRGGARYVIGLLNTAPREYRADLDAAIMANLGKVGENMNDKWRTFNSVASVATVFTTLLFTTLSSVTDFAGVATRSKDFRNMAGMFDAFKRTMSTRDYHELARAVGVVTSQSQDHAMIGMGELDSANRTARGLNDAFFRITGLEWFTRFSRSMAVGMGQQFIVNTANREDFGTRETRWLAELGLTREDVQAWQANNQSFDGEVGEKVRTAIARFADEAIIRPDASQRPVWASNPYMQVVWQLKSYYYGFGKTVLGGMGREMKNRAREDGNFYGAANVAMLFAVTALPLAAAGLAARDWAKALFQLIIPGMPDTALAGHMDTSQYMWEITKRTGVLGPFAIGLTTMEAFKFEGIAAPFTANVPTFDLFDDFVFDGDVTRPIPVLNNVK